MRTHSLTSAVFATLGILGGCSFTGRPINEGTSNDANGGVDTTDAAITLDAPDGNPVVPGDASSTDSSNVDAPAIRTLTETAPDVATEQGAACTAGPGLAIYDGRWYRVFPLGDPFFSVAGGFTVTGVNFSVWKAQGASGVQVQIGTYSGNAPSSTFQPSLVTMLAMHTLALTDASGGMLAHVEITPPIVLSAGAKLAVEVSAASGLELGSIGSSSWTDGFFGSAMCGYVAVASHGFVVTVDGY